MLLKDTLCYSDKWSRLVSDCVVNDYRHCSLKHFKFIYFLILEEINGHDETNDETKVAECAAKEKISECTEMDDSVVKEITTESAVKEQTTETVVKDKACDLILDSPPIEFTIIHNKDKYNVSMPILSTIAQLKDKLVEMIGVPSKMQKIMIKGLAKDDQTLESLNVSSSSKIMVVGAKLQDIVAVSVANVEEVCRQLFLLF